MRKDVLFNCILNVTIPKSLYVEEDRELGKGCTINVRIASIPILYKIHQAYLDNPKYLTITPEALQVLKDRIEESKGQIMRLSYEEFKRCLVLKTLTCNDPSGIYSKIKPGEYVNITLAPIEVLKVIKATYEDEPEMVIFPDDSFELLQSKLK